MWGVWKLAHTVKDGSDGSPTMKASDGSCRAMIVRYGASMKIVAVYSSGWSTRAQWYECSDLATSFRSTGLEDIVGLATTSFRQNVQGSTYNKERAPTALSHFWPSYR